MYPNPYLFNATTKTGLLTRGLSSLKSINWSGLLDGTQKTLGVINQAIPVVYQIKPIVNNARTLFKIAGAITLTTYIDSSKLAIITRTIPLILILFMIAGIITNKFPLEINKLKYFIPIIYSSIISFMVMKKKIITSRHLFSILIDSPLYILFLAALIKI